MTKYIREGRFGKAKQFKTGAVVGTYPKPLLCFTFDEGGLFVFPKKGTLTPKDGLPYELFEEDIKSINPEEFEHYTKKQPLELPKVLAVDFFSYRVGQLTDSYSPAPTIKPFQDFIRYMNILLKTCPWQSVVLDPITGLSEIIHAHVAQTSDSKLKDARKWTPDVGYQIAKVVAQLATLKAHTVCIFHESEQTSEAGATTGIQLMVPSRYGRERVAALLHQILYAEISNGKPIVHTKNFGYVRGVGCRWPANLPEPCGADFKSIYGKEFGL